MTEQLHFHFSLSCIGQGNGNPLQCSCLENPRDGGAWWAAVYGVTQSWTRLKRLSGSHTLATLQFLKFFSTFMLQILLVFSSGIFFCCFLPSHTLMTRSLLHPSGFYLQDSFSVRSSLAALRKTTPTPKPTHRIPLLSLLFSNTYQYLTDYIYLVYCLYLFRVFLFILLTIYYLLTWV